MAQASPCQALLDHQSLLQGDDRQKRNIFCAAPFLLMQPMPGRRLMAVNKIGDNAGKAAVRSPQSAAKPCEGAGRDKARS
jgi:hypothetical protein